MGQAPIRKQRHRSDRTQVAEASAARDGWSVALYRFLALADFDVLAQLALAGGSMRMAELADRALISRSGMTRRVARLVQEGLVRRAHADADARGVVVLLTETGLSRLTETAPVHVRGVSDLFLAKLDDHELAVLESALAKVTLDCTFG